MTDGEGICVEESAFVETIGQKDLQFGGFAWDVNVVAKPTPIFPRLKNDEEVAYIKEEMKKANNCKQINR